MKDICQRYVDHLKNEKSEKAAKDADQRFNRYVYNNTKFAKTDVTKLKPSQIDIWKKALRDTKTTSGSNKGGQRSDSTLNRDITCLRSAFNLAYKEGLVTSDFAWKGKLLPIKNAERKRDVYIDLDQRRKLIEFCPPDLAVTDRALEPVADQLMEPFADRPLEPLADRPLEPLAALWSHLSRY